MVNVHKPKTKDHNEKVVSIQGWHWISAKVKFHKIKSLRSIRDGIRKNQKSKD
jgi:hypothetical protein